MDVAVYLFGALLIVPRVFVSLAMAQVDTSPGAVSFTVKADSFDFLSGGPGFGLPQLISVSSGGGAKVEFKYTPVPVFGKPDFIIVSPSGGVTPALVRVAP